MVMVIRGNTLCTTIRGILYMGTNAHSKTARATEKKVERAFLQLMSDNNFDQITVSGITRIAKINRSTYYAHYKDKYDMVDQFADKLINHIVELLKRGLTSLSTDGSTKDEKTTSGYKQILTYISDNRNLISTIYNILGYTRIKDKVLDRLDTNERVALNNKKDFVQMTTVVPSDYAFDILVSTVLNVVNTWATYNQAQFQRQVTDIIQKTQLFQVKLQANDNRLDNNVKSQL